MTQFFKTTLFSFCIIILTCFSCSKDDDNSATNDTFADLSNISGDEGSRIVLTQNNEDLIYTGQNVLGWGTNQLLNQNYVKDLRLLHDGFDTIEIRMSVPADLDFVDAAVASHGLNGSTLLLQNTENLDDVIVEMYTSENLERDHFFGTLEIRRNVPYLNDVLDMVGTFEITRDGQSITGLFWKKEVSNW